MAEISSQVPVELYAVLQPADSDNRRVALMTCGISGLSLTPLRADLFVDEY